MAYLAPVIPTLPMRSHLRLTTLIAPCVGLFFLNLLRSPANDGAGAAPLRIEQGASQVWLTLNGADHGQVHHLETSQDLVAWREVAFSNVAFERYAFSGEGARRFFRSRSLSADDSSDWTNQLQISDGRIFSDPSAGNTPAFAKFTVEIDDPARVYFQDSDRYPFHFQFARARLPGYQNISLQEYERISLFREDHELLLGTVILPPDPSVTELAIQFTGREAFAIEDIARWYESVRSRVLAPEGWRYFYLPSFEQSEAAFDNEQWFAEQGILVDTAARWITDNACYSSAWALGRLKYFAAGEIDTAYGDGRLTNADILLTDQVPAEIPVVAGLLTLAPATPNSHVAILSRSFGIPFAYASGDALQDQARALAGREVLLVVELVGDECVIRIQDVEGKLTPEERQAILDSKVPPAIEFTPIARAGSYSLETPALTPADIALVGGKAANFGFLRRVIAGHAPDPAIALTFDLWSDFMAQPFGDGTLAESITRDLGGQTFPPDLSQLRPKLDAIRERIRKQADFSPAQRISILGALEPFADDRNVRFRSSTNVEDSTGFSGAGLYDSFSGCIKDDTDADENGPSHCDPERAEERGVFRAIRKVYASFYNENAFIERLRHGVDESQVGMAVLVHYSFPDEIELANGVATLEIQRPEAGERAVAAQLVSQVGASSITNPDSNLQAEVVRAVYLDLPVEPALTVEQISGLLGEGETVLAWTGGYSELVGLLDLAALAYEAFYPAEPLLELDFEWKYVAPGNLVIKQIRRIPHLPSPPPPIIE